MTRDQIILKRVSNVLWHIETNRWVGDKVTLDAVEESLRRLLEDAGYDHK